MTRLLLVVAIALGLLIGYFDSRPNWDDAGITALAIVVACGLFSVASPRYPWLWALAVGVWIPAFGIALSRNFGSLLALVFAFAGAYAGLAFRRLVAPV